MRMPRIWLLGTALLCAVASPARGADGLDTSWNGTGIVSVQVPGYGFEVSFGPATMVVQPDGRILLAASCNAGIYNHDLDTICMARLLPSGAIDYSFGQRLTGMFAFAEFPGYPPSAFIGTRGLLRQRDGRIVVAGSADAQSHSAAVTRLATDGTPDGSSTVQPVTFEFSHHENQPLSFITAIAQQADGKLVVAGYTHAYNTTPPNTDFAVARLRTDLSLDSSFNGTGKIVIAFDRGGNNEDEANALAILPDGKIVVAGYAATASAGKDVALARVNANGTLDTTFGDQGRATFDFGTHKDNVANAVKVDAAGRIWIAGYKQYSATDFDFAVARVLADGSALDAGFCNNGYQTVLFDLGNDDKIDIARDLLLQSDGKIVLVGDAKVNSLRTQFAAARLLPNCQLDATFGNGGKLHDVFPGNFGIIRDYLTSAAFGNSGIVAAGYSETERDGWGRFGVAQIRLDRIFTNSFED